MQLPDTAVCLQCGYLLRGLPEMRCPECGRAFDPNDPSTFGPLPGPRWLRRWAEPPPRWQAYGIIGITFVLFYYYSLPGSLRSYPPFFDVLFLIWFALSAFISIGLDYLIRAVAWISYLPWRPAPTKPPDRVLWRWMAIPIGLLMIYTAPAYHWPLHVRFCLSQPAFERVAQARLQGQQCDTKPRWVGLYYVRSIGGCGPGAIVFKIETRGKGVESVGFVYDPRKPPGWNYGPCVAPNWYIYWW